MSEIQKRSEIVDINDELKLDQELKEKTKELEEIMAE